MAMSRAAVATGVGGPEMVEIVSVEVADPAPDEVTIAVRAAGINPIDVKQFARPGATFPLRLGKEVAGVVTVAGGGFAVGDEVVAYPVTGGYAELLTVPVTSVFPKPSALSWEQAANLMLVGVTAWHLLEATGVAAGDRVLVHGASGGVGLAACQLALLRGAVVVGTASASNQQLLRDHGVTPVVYGPGLADRVREVFPEGVDVALDTVGTDEAIDVSVELVADRDRIATIAGFAHGAEVGIRMLGGGPGADPGREIRSAARSELVRLADHGELDIIVARTFPLDDVRAALELVASGHPGGQVALTP